MLVKFNVKSKSDKKPTIYVDHLLKHFIDGVGLKANQFVRVFFKTRNNQEVSYLFKASRAQRGTAFTLFGYEEWFTAIPLPKIGEPIEYDVTHFIVNPNTDKALIYYLNKDKVVKPRPEAFPQDFLGNGLINNNSIGYHSVEDKCEKINPLDERLERLKVEINAALILAGGTHKGDHSIGEFRNVMSNVLSSVDKKTLIKIIENAYI